MRLNYRIKKILNWQEFVLFSGFLVAQSGMAVGLVSQEMNKSEDGNFIFYQNSQEMTSGVGIRYYIYIF